MAKPAFIYAFDNLGPYRFAELCGDLFGSRYPGFLLGGEGPDGSIDGELRPQVTSDILNEIVEPGKTVIFQFKHKVIARVGGQVNARAQLLDRYKCSPRKKCELHSKLIEEKKPSVYFLVTNVEVNSQFRNSFIQQCKSHYPAIEHYQVFGLDELEDWISMQTQLRHLYFPTIFGLPRYDLRLEIYIGRYEDQYILLNPHPDIASLANTLSINVLNVGSAPSYIEKITFHGITNGELTAFRPNIQVDEELQRFNPPQGTAVEPGRRQTHHFRLLNIVQLMRMQGEDFFPTEIRVHDEIGNAYSKKLPDFRVLLVELMKKITL